MLQRLLFIILIAFAGCLHAADYGGIPEKFFSQLIAGETDEAIDFLYSTNQWVQKNSDQVANLKGELRKLKSLVGQYLFHELLTEHRVGSRYAHLIYLVGYERQPLRFQIKLYKPQETWRFQGVSFDADLTDDIEELSNEKLLQ